MLKFEAIAKSDEVSTNKTANDHGWIFPYASITGAASSNEKI